MAVSCKLMVTGANGFVAGSILADAGAGFEVHALSRGAATTSRRNLHWHTCGSLEGGALAAVVRAVKPDAVIHTAALADIDFCQANPVAACAVNVELTRTLAGLCAESGSRLIYCSTDTVFDGEHAPYAEEDPTGPVNRYAQTKVEAEQIVAASGAPAVIARLALVVGLPVLGAGNSFLARMVASFRAGQTVSVPALEVRTPVDVITAGRALVELAVGEQRGIFHLAGSERLSRFEMAQRIARRFGFPDRLVTAQPAASASGRAPRPRDVSLANAKACANLKTPMRRFDEALSLILETAAKQTR